MRHSCLYPRDYPWSSYRVNAEGKASDLITPHRLYQRLGLDADERRQAYRGLFKTDLDAGLIKTITDTTNSGFVLGSARFIAQVEQHLGRRAKPGKAGRPTKDSKVDDSRELD